MASYAAMSGEEERCIPHRTIAARSAGMTVAVLAKFEKKRFGSRKKPASYGRERTISELDGNLVDKMIIAGVDLH